jgi:hypothetical protein
VLALFGAAQGAGHATAAAVRPSKIVLFRSIGVVSLGDSPRRVWRRLGEPTHVIRLAAGVVQMQYRRFGLDIHFNNQHKGDPVNFVATGASRFQTSKGIHPGSTLQALKRAYQQRLHGAGPVYSLYGKRGRTRTDFNIAHRRVQSIDIQA